MIEVGNIKETFISLAQETTYKFSKQRFIRVFIIQHTEKQNFLKEVSERIFHGYTETELACMI
jgi:hypothetical protein